MFRFSDLEESDIWNEVNMHLYSQQETPRYVDLPYSFLICSDGQKVFVNEKDRHVTAVILHAAVTYDSHEDYLDRLRLKGIDIPPVERSVCRQYMEDRGITEYKVSP